MLGADASDALTDLRDRFNSQQARIALLAETLQISRAALDNELSAVRQRLETIEATWYHRAWMWIQGIQ